MPDPDTLPPGVRSEVELQLGEVAPDPVRFVERLGGGCIHPAARLETEGGRLAFVKWALDPVRGGFAQEASGLRALAAAGGPPVPRVLGVSEEVGPGPSWLLLEWIEPGAASPDTPRALGQGLARLHRPLPGAEPGWDAPNRIGPLEQMNPGGLSWPRFWAEARLGQRWEEVRRAGALDGGADAEMEWLLGSMEGALAGWEADGIALLHGDLWSGNVVVDARSEAWLIDPSSYRGHREVDLAMMELFGGFDREVFRAIEAESPILPGYREVRRSIYALYPLLVHVRLFGGGYRVRTLETLRSVVARLR